MTGSMPTDEPRLRSALQGLRHDAVLDAVAALAADRGWKQVRMEDIARAAGVSRRSLFNEFGSKAALLDALAWRNTDRLLRGAVAAMAAHPDDLAAALAAAAAHVLSHTADDPLHQRALAGQPGAPDAMLTVLTTQSGPFREMATTFLMTHARTHWKALEPDDERLRFAIDSFLRMLVSHIVQPAAAPVAETSMALGRLAARALQG